MNFGREAKPDIAWRRQKDSGVLDRSYWTAVDEDILDLLEENGVIPPRGFKSMSRVDQLDYVATRILANARTTKSITEMKEEGILSDSQMDRRLAREVYASAPGGLEREEPTRGVFSRPYIKKPPNGPRKDDR